MVLTEDQKVEMKANAITILTGTFIEDPNDPFHPYVQIIDGDEAKPDEWIVRAWLKEDDFKEYPDDPNLELKGNNGSISESTSGKAFDGYDVIDKWDD